MVYAVLSEVSSHCAFDGMPACHMRLVEGRVRTNRLRVHLESVRSD